MGPKKFKIIQINSASSSCSTGSYEKDIYDTAWNVRITRQIKKFLPDAEIECWAIEKEYKKEDEKYFRGVKFRIFPTTISIRHGMELSFSMIKAVLNETKKAESSGKELIIHFHEYHSWQVYLMLALIRKSKKTKIIAQHHGGRSPLKNISKYKRLILFLPALLLMQIFENIYFKKVNIFYALSNDEINYLTKIAPKSEIKFQSMGIGEDYFEIAGKNFARKKLKLNLNKKYLLYLGRVKTTKGIKELIDAMKNFHERNIELLIIGEGVDLEKYKDYTTQNNIKCVSFLGPKYGEEKKLFLSACDCLILPSYTEGAPVVLMEAIARNLPVIATNVGGIPKMIKNGREGIIITPKSEAEIRNAIEKILKWRKKNISKYAEKYKWRHIIKNTLIDYEK